MTPEAPPPTLIPDPGRPSPKTGASRVLIADDDDALRRLFTRTLSLAGYEVEAAPDGQAAIEILRRAPVDVIVSDITMPEMNGLELLSAVRALDLDVPVVLVTGAPELSTAVKALEYGALRYLVKPVEIQTLRQVVDQAARLGRVARLKREALRHLGETGMWVGDRAGLEQSFRHALETLSVAYQPIVSWSHKSIFGYEALVRTEETALPLPDDLLSAAERLGRVHAVGQAVRAKVASMDGNVPASGLLFVNIHPRDLLDDSLLSPASPLSSAARRVVLEITERASLHEIGDVRRRVERLRALGFRIAIDDLGAGYAGLSSFALLEPDVVKLDMALVRRVHAEPIKQRLIRSMVLLCQEAGMQVIAEGVETVEERDALVLLGCDLLQGYLFAMPAAALPQVRW